MADKDPVSLLGERSQRLGLGNIREAYSVTEVRHGEQAWEIQLHDDQTQKNVSSGVHSSKRKALREAAKRLLKELGEGGKLGVEGEAAIPKSLNDDALIGDKVLGLCLVMWLRQEYQIVDKGVVTRMVSNLVSNEALQRNAHKIGISVSGFQTPGRVDRGTAGVGDFRGGGVRCAEDDGAGQADVDWGGLRRGNGMVIWRLRN